MAVAGKYLPGRRAATSANKARVASPRAALIVPKPIVSRERFRGTDHPHPWTPSPHGPAEKATLTLKVSIDPPAVDRKTPKTEWSGALHTILHPVLSCAGSVAGKPDKAKRATNLPSNPAKWNGPSYTWTALGRKHR